MSDILERLDDLRIFVRDNSYESKISMRAVVELYAGELLHDLRDAADEIERLRAVVDAARELRDFENSDAPMDNMEDDIHREELILAVTEAVCALDGE